MSRPNIPASDVSYDPLPNPSEHDTPYDSRDMVASTPQLDNFEFEQLPGGAARPRFMGAAASGPSVRDSFTSYGTNPVSENDSSVFALNPESLSARGSPLPGDEGRYHDDPRETGGYDDEPGVPMSPLGGNRYLSEKHATYAAPAAKSRRNIIILSAIAGLIIIIVAVVVPVYFAVVKPHSSSTKGAAASDAPSKADPTASTSSAGAPSNRAAVSGGDGSKVTMDDGTTFTYQNSFGGIWYHDPADPFNNGARPQSWSPALNETFNWGVDRIRGVNLGGWFTTEPFIAPALYEKYVNSSTPAVDEWTLSQAMAADTASGGLGQLEKHYQTFITEQDFAEIAAAGLNFVRIPLPFWAIETWDGEPFLAKTAWKYFLKAIGWARKYGIRINLDFHAVPGSQNGWNHSGRLGTVNMLNGPMGLANAQRSLDYIRIIAEFISQPQYKDVIVMFGITNEPQAPVVGQDNLSRYYVRAYNLVRQASGTGAGNGPFVSYHDGFLGLDKWSGFMTGADRIALDYHPYLCFSTQSSQSMHQQIKAPCDAWGAQMNASMGSFGLTAAGEFSNAVTDCGLYVNGVGLGTRYEGTYTPGNWPAIGSCQPWTDWQNWNQAMKNDIKSFALASMDALQNWFFWTWKIGNSSVTGKVESPAWSYQLGLQNGWMPTDPRTAAGTCGNTSPFSGPLAPNQVGGQGAAKLDPAVSSEFAWPPTTISGADGPATQLPLYTPTGTIPTLGVPTFTASGASTVSVGNGWANPSDSKGAYVPIASCSYLSPWVESNAAVPPACAAATGAAAAAKRDPVPGPQITVPPAL
ncbi:exo-beta-1,3-glucanase [Dentipellis sp. KUC8613]|nr:exo-beta-1,3-glucanase [Dentipellis sp. KUC8613]